MVVLAVAIVDKTDKANKTGKVHVSRQFQDLTRSRIEELLASFSKQVDPSQQHTMIEADKVRYVYEPLNEFYVVLITNIRSNILQDIKTLNLFTKVIEDTLDRSNISEKVFELLFAFDEIISEGFGEDLKVQTVKDHLEMESHEERLHEAITRNKEREAKEESIRKAEQFKMEKREALRRQRPGMGGDYSPLQETRTTEMPSYIETTRSVEPRPSKPRNTKGMQLGKSGARKGKPLLQ